MKKYRNLHFKAKIGNTIESGKMDSCLMGIALDSPGPYIRLTADEFGRLLGGECVGRRSRKIREFEIVPRDPETYRDWQVGDSLLNEDISSSGELPDGRVIFRSGEFVVIADWQGNASPYTCDELYDEGYRLVLTDIEKLIIEERKKAEWEPQDGDVCYVEASDGYYSIFIYKNGSHRTNYYASLDTDKGCSTILLIGGGHVVANSKITVLRPATEDEKQKLFNAMAKQGKRWNAEKKSVEDILKPYEFRKGEPVLVRDNDENIWILSSFIQFIPTSCFHVTNGVRPSHWKQCIPYNEKTMHLLGTSEDYKEEQR